MRRDDDEDLPSDGEDIALLLQRLFHLVRASEYCEGLNPAQWEALRFVAHANRFSNSPGALARFIGSTKGTVSQTVKALEKKGLIERSTRRGERRSIALSLTSEGDSLLSLDPLQQIATAAQALGNKGRRRLSRGLNRLLREKLAKVGLANFGKCVTCRFFRERGRELDLDGPHSCMFFDEPLNSMEIECLCSSHESRL